MAPVRLKTQRRVIWKVRNDWPQSGAALRAECSAHPSATPTARTVQAKPTTSVWPLLTISTQRVSSPRVGPSRTRSSGRETLFFVGERLPLGPARPIYDTPEHLGNLHQDPGQHKPKLCHP